MKKSETLVVFLGWGSIEKSYKKFFELAPANWEVVVVPYREFTREGSYQELNNALSRKLVRKKAILVGHSMGGALALKFAHTYPQNVKQLYLIDSEGIYGNENLLVILWGFIISNSTFFRKNLNLLLISLLEIFKSPLWHLKMARFARNADLKEESRNIRIPTHIFWGEKDKVVPLWQGQVLHQLIPQSKLVVLNGMGHDWVLHSPELFWERLK